MARRPSAVPALALALTLAACTAGPPVGAGSSPAAPARTPRPSAGPSAAPSAAASATPTPKASAGASAAPSVAPPAPATPAPLGAPAGLEAMAGSVRIDAAYAVASGQGRLLEGAGTPTLAVGPAGLAAPAGTNLGAPDAARILSHNGGQILSHNGGLVLSHNGSAIISQNGSTIISQNGSTIISQNGSTIISQNGSMFGLLQAPAAGASAAPVVGAAGGQTPAGGMLVGLLDLASGGLAPVGQDAAGKPVYGAYTDAAGGFTIWPPADLGGNVAVIVVPPGETADPRLAYGLVTAADSAEALVDEDQALTTRVLREAFATRLAAMLVAADPVKQADEMLGGGGITSVLTPTFKELNAAAQAAGLREAPPAEVEAIARRMCDVLLATVDLQGMTVRVEQADNSYAEPVPVIASMAGVFREARQATSAKLAAEPGYFDAQPWLQAANAGRTEATAYRVRKASDLGTFLVEAYLKDATKPTYQDISTVFRAIGVGTNGKGFYNSAAETVDNGAQLVATAIVGVLVSDDGQTMAKLKATLAARRAP